MRKLLFVLVWVAAAAGGWFALGMPMPGGGVDAQRVRALAGAFLEDVQYKDFDKAAAYHTDADREKADIPALIERTFQVRPEQLNISDVRITSVDLAKNGLRARSFFTARNEVLNTGDQDDPNHTKTIEGILYWHKRPAGEGLGGENAAAAQDGMRWYLMLESSLH